MNEASQQTGSEVWQDLVSTALVGTDRRTPPAAGDFAAPGDSPAAALLSSAALMSAWRRAGNAGSAYSAVLVGEQDDEPTGPAAPRACRPRSPSALDARPLLPTATSARLTALVASRSEALPEYLGAAAKTGCRAPAELLPPLFDYARGSIAVRADLMKLAGPRGTWLAKQNQQWSTFTRFAAAPDPEAWLSDKPHERIGYLNWFRGKDPASARALVEEAWTPARARRGGSVGGDPRRLRRGAGRGPGPGGRAVPGISPGRQVPPGPRRGRAPAGHPAAPRGSPSA